MPFSIIECTGGPLKGTKNHKRTKCYICTSKFLLPLSAQSPHPCVRPSPDGYSQLICKSPLSLLSTQGKQYSKILHALCLLSECIPHNQSVSTKQSVFKILHALCVVPFILVLLNNRGNPGAQELVLSSNGRANGIVKLLATPTTKSQPFTHFSPSDPYESWPILMVNGPARMAPHFWP